jgi:peptidoglycan/LPS O-acetylase OafA/YrhL
MQRYETIQALRFVAALLVVITHSTLYAHERLVPDFPIWRGGGHGVDIFFVISGFVMIVSTQRFIGQRDDWYFFIKNRIIRVVPLYWLATSIKLVSFFLFPALVLHSRFDFFHIFSSYFFIPTKNIDGHIKPLLGVGWTLMFEMFFYVTFTVALFLRTNVTIFVGVVMIVCTVGYFFRPEGYPAVAVYLSPVMLEFWIGMLMAVYSHRLNAPIWVWVGIAALGAVALLFFDEGERSNLLAIPAAVAIVLGAIKLEGSVGRFIPYVVLFGGTISYSLYLFHPIFAPIAPVILKKLGIGMPTLSILLSVGISVALATIVYWVFERPVTNMLRAQFKSS